MRWTQSAWWKPDRRRSERPARSGPVEKSQRRLGLALSAGGAKGLAHVGVLQVLEENNIEIDAISGCSMGAYVGALWACGYSGTDLEELAAEIQDRKTLWKLADPVLPPLSGLFFGEKAKRHLMKSIGELRFEDLTRRLLIVTFDLDTKERLVRREGRIADAVHASCAMPGIIRPVLLDGHRCADGGVVDPVPVSSLEKFSEVDVTVAVSVLPSLGEVERFAHEPALAESERPGRVRRLGNLLNRQFNLLAPGNVLDTLRKSVQAAQLRIAAQSCKRATLCIQPAFALPGLWHDYTNFRHYIDAGRAAAEAALPALRTLLDRNVPLPHDHESSLHSLLVGERVA
jgi:NTE family protein